MPQATIPAERTKATQRRHLPATGCAHLVGIGGAGMRALAHVLLDRGWRLSGSDLAEVDDSRLRGSAARLARGHDATHLPPETDLLIYSAAVDGDNPERRAAQRRGIPCWSYAETLGALMAGSHGLAVAGTHGKSTTTAMAAQILCRAGLDPTVVLGAEPIQPRHGDDAAGPGVAGGRSGSGGWTLVEACEYRGNFLHLRPEAAVLLPVDQDHFDCFPRRDQMEAAYRRFVSCLPPQGLLLVSGDCRRAQRIARAAACRRATWGFASGCDWRAAVHRAERGCCRLELVHRGQPLADVRLRVPGRHNAVNALAAAALAGELGIDAATVAAALARFAGLRRRLEVVGCPGGVTLVDDYAHHPREVAAALAAARAMFPGRRLTAVFQPHQESRTRRLLDEFALSLQNADTVVVTEVFHAREPHSAAPGSAVRLARRAGAAFAPRGAPMYEMLEASLTAGDVLITLGAGDIRNVCNDLANRLGRHRAA